jgi:hypothetical protein
MTQQTGLQFKLPQKCAQTGIYDSWAFTAVVATPSLLETENQTSELTSLRL